MPTYEYKCKQCDERFEIEQSIADDALTSLPGCSEGEKGDHLLKKVFSAVGISFKGDGFYRNDARSKPKTASSSSASTASTSGDDSSTSSTSTTTSDSSSSGGSDSSGSSDSSGGSGSKAAAASSSSD